MQEAFQLFFEKTYIIVVPTFKDTLVHHHNMLHVFFGNGDLQLSAGEKDLCGNVIILEIELIYEFEKSDSNVSRKCFAAFESSRSFFQAR